jgi:hypothetical protein
MYNVKDLNTLILAWQRIHAVLRQDIKRSSVKDKTGERTKSLMQRKTECYDRAI